MVLHGGHDGTRHLQDTHIFDFTNQCWSTLITEGQIPSPRDSHVAVIFGKSMYLYGGSTGVAMSDFHALTFDFRRVWSPVLCSSSSNPSNTTNMTNNRSNRVPSTTVTMIDDDHEDLSLIHTLPTTTVSTTTTGTIGSASMLTPGPRFCHVGIVYENAFYIFGGYDGSNRLNDFLKFTFDGDYGLQAYGGALVTPTPTIVSYMIAPIYDHIYYNSLSVIDRLKIYEHM